MEKDSLYGNGLLSIVKGSGLSVAISFLARIIPWRFSTLPETAMGTFL